MKGNWNSESEQQRITQTVQDMIVHSPKGMAAPQILSALPASDRATLTRSHINSVLYQLCAQGRARQVNPGQNPPRWVGIKSSQCVKAETIREGLRGRFHVPSHLQATLDACPFAHVWEVEGEDRQMVCEPKVSSQVVDWLRAQGFTVRSLVERLADLAVAPAAELGEFGLIDLNNDWSVYDAELARWHFLPREYRPEGPRAIVAEGASLRQQRSKGFLFYFREGSERQPLEGEDAAILRMLAIETADRVPIPSTSRRGFVFLDVSRHWLPRTWFNQFAALRPGKKYYDKKLVFLESDQELVEEALRRLHLTLGEWLPPAQEKEKEQAGSLELLSQVVGQAVYYPKTADERISLLIEESPDPAAAELRCWIDEGFLRPHAASSVEGLVLGIDRMYRYEKGQFKAAGWRHWMLLPEFSRVVNYLAPAASGGVGRWLRITPTLFLPAAGILKGKAALIPGQEIRLTDALPGTFQSAMELLEQRSATCYLGDMALPFPSMGRPCRLALVRGSVVTPLGSSGLRPMVKLADAEGDVHRVVVPWDAYIDRQHPVHLLTAGDAVNAVLLVSDEKYAEERFRLVSFLPENLL